MTHILVDSYDPPMRSCPACKGTGDGGGIDCDGKDETCGICEGTGEVEVDPQDTLDAYAEEQLQRWKDGEIAINGRYRGDHR